MQSRVLTALVLAIALCVIAAAALTQSQLPLFQLASVGQSPRAPTIPLIIPATLVHKPSSAPLTFGVFPVPTVPKAESADQALPTVDQQAPAAPSSVQEPVFNTEAVNAAARAATVNIFCQSPAGEEPLSASGVIIDPRGIVLTNAHVAQYLLLRDAGALALNCTARTGSPAVNAWHLEVLYVSTQWVNAHAHEIRTELAVGTGENDYALLYLTTTTNGSTRQTAFPYLPPAVGSAAAYPGQQVLLSSYPAGFLGSVARTRNLSLVTTTTTVKQVLSFGDGSFDIAALGGVVVAQTGSSGGAVVDAAKQLVGVIVTTSLAEETSGRDLHAVTIAHISSSLDRESGLTLSEYLSSNIFANKTIFDRDAKPTLMQKLVDGLSQ